MYKYSRCMYCKYSKFQMFVDIMKEIKQGMRIECVRAHRSGSLLKIEWSKNASMRRWHLSSNLNKEEKGATYRMKVRVFQGREAGASLECEEIKMSGGMGEC